ncbi:MAG TPA: amidohydrolase family protein [Gammaproteobacteria bacterium]|nr:amidohydrolase family protein [Gammaproteobacteria bacterium]HIL99254.1 amidohydrolase family protein [Pseudomonadales bacterium]
MLRKLTVLLTTLLLIPSAALAETILHCERLIDGSSDMVHERQSIRIEGTRITSIENGFVEADLVIDIGDATCMPGLMDMHVHITSELNPKRFENKFKLDPQDSAFASVRYANATLMAGFTTVRDLGSANNLSISMRKAINQGYIVGPRIYTAGTSLATTGGHADPTNGVNSKFRGDPGPKDGVINSVEDARKAVRQRYKEGADLIKITATGGVLSQASSGQNAQFTEEELRAIISIAKDYNFKVAAHAHGTEGMQRAIRAGIDSIEHGTYMDRPTMKLMKKHGTTFVPTIMAGKFVAEKSKIDGYFSDVVRPKAAKIGPLIQNTFAEAYEMGVKIAFGTDTGVSAHGDNWKEFVFMVEAGMPAMEAIQSATSHGAMLLGIEDSLGTLETGKIADIIAVKGDPLADINQMQFVEFVMKEGVVYKR